MDLVGPLPQTPDGYTWVFAVEDTATRWIELFPLRQATAQACARVLVDEIVLRYGTPRKVINDNGGQFTGEIMQQVVHCLGFKQTLTPLYHPAANPEERKNRDLKTQISILVERQHDQWAEGLPAVRFAMNSAPGLSTGYSPAFLCFGREMRTPHDVETDLRPIIENEPVATEIVPKLAVIAEALKDARETQERERDRNKQYADAKRRETVDFVPGDRVLVATRVLSSAAKGLSAKFVLKRDGPYVIRKRVSPTAYEVSVDESSPEPLGVYHVSALTKFVEPVRVQTVEPIYPIRKKGRPRGPRPPSVKEHPLEQNPTPLPVGEAPVGRPSRFRKPPSRFRDYTLDTEDPRRPGSAPLPEPEGEDVTP